MKDTSHLVALQDLLSRQLMRLSSCDQVSKTIIQARVDSARREVEQEMIFLSMDSTLPNINDDDLLSELGI